MLVVLAGQAVKVQRLANRRFHPVGELGIPRLPAREPRLEVLLGLFEIPPVVEPAQLLPAIVVGFAGEIVQCVPQKVHVAPLPHRLGQQLPDRPFDPGVIVGDHKLHPPQPARLQPVDKRRPTRLRLASGQLHAEHLAPAFPVNAERNEHRLGLDHPVEPDLLVPRIEDHIRIRFLEAALGKAPEQLIQPCVDPADRASPRTCARTAPR